MGHVSDTIPHAWVASALEHMRQLKALPFVLGRLVHVDAPAFRTATNSDSATVATIVAEFGDRGRLGDQSRGRECLTQLGRDACQAEASWVTLSLARVVRNASAEATFDMVIGQPTNGRSGWRLDIYAFKVSAHASTGAPTIQLLYIARAE